MARPSSPLAWIGPVLRYRPFWLALAAFAIGGIALLLLFNYAVMPLWTRHNAGVAVPEVRELSARDAARRLAASGLGAEMREQPYNPNLPADIVVDQTPLPSSHVKPGRRVYYYVNTAPKEMVSVPSVVSLSEGVAKAEIQEAGLIVDAVKMDSLRTPFEGTVTRQTPPGRTHRTTRHARYALAQPWAGTR